MAVSNTLVQRQGIALSISEDKMSVYLHWDGIKDVLRKDLVLKLLQNSNVVFGIKVSLLQNIEELRKILEKQKIVTIAEGISALNGEPGRLVFFFDTARQPGRPKQDSKGRVNYRELQYIDNVRSGAMLAEKKSPTAAKHGHNVFGDVIPGEDGREAVLECGKGVDISADGNRFYAGCDGMPVLSDNQLSVNSKVTINRNIDYGIGNINFVGDVEIFGSVEQGFRVKSEKGIVIKGNVNGGSIEAREALYVEGGIISGVRHKVKAGGSVYAGFVENSHISTGRDLLAEQSLLHSHVTAAGRIVVGRSLGKGIVTGGVYYAGVLFKAESLGGVLGTKTRVVINFTENYYNGDDQYAYYSGLKTKQHFQKDLIKKTYKMIDNIKDTEKMDFNQKVTMIEDLNGRIFDAKCDLNSINKKIDDLEVVIQQKGFLLGPMIIVRQVVWPGVEIVLNGTLLKIRRQLEGTVFEYSDGRIIQKGYEAGKYDTYWLN